MASLAKFYLLSKLVGWRLEISLMLGNWRWEKGSSRDYSWIRVSCQVKKNKSQGEWDIEKNWKYWACFPCRLQNPDAKRNQNSQQANMNTNHAKDFLFRSSDTASTVKSILSWPYFVQLPHFIIIIEQKLHFFLVKTVLTFFSADKIK